MRARHAAQGSVIIWLGVLILLSACAPQQLPPTAPVHPDDSRPALPPTATPQDTGYIPASPAPAAPAGCLAQGAFPSLFAGLRAGVNAFLLSTDVARTIALIQHADFAWVRQQIHWRDVEGSPGRYNWSALDQVITAAHQANLHILLSVVASPHWATANQAGGLPDDPGDARGLFTRAGSALRRIG